MNIRLFVMPVVMCRKFSVQLAVCAGFFASTVFAHASDTPLFPKQPAPELAISPVESAKLPPIKPETETAVMPPPSGGPLRVVIPNIRTKPVAKADKPKRRYTRIDKTKTHASLPVSNELPPLIPGVRPNGVILDQFAGQHYYQQGGAISMLTTLPASWIVGANPAFASAVLPPDAESLAQYAPAAGGADSPQPPAGNNGNIIPMIATPGATLPPPASPPPAPMNDTAPAKTYGASQHDPSEPEPTLSPQSKAILDKLPSLDETSKEPRKEVSINRESPSPEMGSGFQATSHESKGIQVDIKQRNADVSYDLEKAYEALIAGRSDVAIEIYGDILTNAPKNQDALFGLASTYHRVGQLDLARSLYGKLLELNPKHRDGLNNFLVLLSEEAPEEALRHMARLETQNPGFSPIPAQMAIIYKKLGDNEKAVDKMYHALSLSPENVTYRYNLAVMLDRAGHYERAATLYGQVLKSYENGEDIPGDANKIQQRLTFIRSNTLK